MKCHRSVFLCLCLGANFTRAIGNEKFSGFAVLAGTRTMGNGDSNPLPDNLAYKFTIVTKNGLEANLGVGDQTLGKRFWFGKHFYTSLHGGMSVMVNKYVSYGPSAHFTTGVNPLCFFVCLTFELSGGVGLNTSAYGARAIPISAARAGVSAWW